MDEAAIVKRFNEIATDDPATIQQAIYRIATEFALPVETVRDAVVRHMTGRV